MKFGSLQVTGADGQLRELPIDLPVESVGSAVGNGVLLQDPSVGARHARIIIESGRMLVEDLGTEGGTFIDGQRIPPNTPSLVEPGQSVRFGNVEGRYAAPIAGVQPGGASKALPPNDADSASAPLRFALTGPSAPVQAGDTVFATLTVQNRGRLVDQVAVSVTDLPAGWATLSTATLSLLPGAREDVVVVITPPRAPESTAGQHVFTVVGVSAQQGHQAAATGNLTVLPFESTSLSLQPAQGRRDFRLVGRNNGNALATYALSGVDDEQAFVYEFDSPTLVLQPGEERSIGLVVEAPGKRAPRGSEIQPFKVVAAPTAGPGPAIEVAGQLVLKTQSGHRKLLAALAALLLLAALAAAAWLLWPSDKSKPQPADPESAFAGVHMCGPGNAQVRETATAAGQKAAAQVRAGGASGSASDAASSSGAPFFAQNDPQWGAEEYAKAKDPDFGPDWCGTTIAQCGCAMTSVATIMALFQLISLPNGVELTPKTLNDWFNLDARKTNRGWVSVGYVYGDVIWTAVNQLSGEIARQRPGTTTLRFARTGSGSDAEIRSELAAGRPIILEVPGHWIAAVGTDGDKILINDPYYGDRKTLDVYAGRVRSSVLFEPSTDLSAVVITAPSDLRVRVTDNKGRVVGTLNPGTPQEAKGVAQAGIPGSSYSLKAAWRDPSCVESPPPPGAGTNQLILPGTRGDYRIEVVNPNGGPTSVAIHSYDKDGKLTLQTEDNPGPVVMTMSYDPSTGKPPSTATVLPGVTPAPESPTPVVSPGNGGGGTTTPPAVVTTVAPPSVTTTTTTATVPPSATTAAPPSATTTVPPAAPTPVVLDCPVTYDYTASPATAAINCTATVTGTSDSATWKLNGLEAKSFAGKTAFTTAFFATSVVPLAPVQIVFTACNQGKCTDASATVTITFTPGASPSPTSGSVTPVPPGPVGVTCSYQITASATAQIDCQTAFTLPYTEVQWTATGTGVSPTSQVSGIKTFTTFTASAGVVVVQAKACNFAACTTSAPVQVTVVGLNLPTQVLVDTGGGGGPTDDLIIYVNVNQAPFALPYPTGQVQFLDGTTVLGTMTLNAGGSATFTWTGVKAVGDHILSVRYLGSLRYAPSVSESFKYTVFEDP